MKVAIVGSRDYPLEHLVREFVRRLALKDPNAVVVSGGARGVDSWAVDEAKRCGLGYEELHADWDGLGKSAGKIRNSTIVARSAVIVAFWDESSTGTKDTIDKGMHQDKKVRVFGLAGLPIDCR